ncbi:unnamed protein product [Lactuca saligna]|uniref:F-box domain-containing protein n=1 Tax=Lactuca saligna TaxID=75948 RepID=A0AA35ZQ09_LACSI|nr:unnamed protein product [Lactuca saligna]
MWNQIKFLLKRKNKDRRRPSQAKVTLTLETASPQHPDITEKLPSDVLSNIFIRLLAKEIAQLRCVCKSWNALLSESSFIKSHLHHSIHHKDEILLFFRHAFSFDRRPFTAHTSHSPDLELTNFIKLPTSPQSKDTRGDIIGSVNGLICFKYGSYDYAIHIWNPSLSMVLTLPPYSLPKDEWMVNHFRFGYDPKTDDYKVVKLTKLSGAISMLSQVEVYSMRKGLWQLITQRFPSNIKWVSDEEVVCVDGHEGHVHWLGYTDMEQKLQTILAFDLGAETFREIPLPDSILHLHEECLNAMGVLGGKLCVMSCIFEAGKCEVWEMEEYGVTESWVKHHGFSQFSADIVPYGFTLRGEFLFQVDEDANDDCLVLYDPIAAMAKNFKKMGRITISKVVEYVDSLVWVVPEERDISSCSISKF